MCQISYSFCKLLFLLQLKELTTTSDETNKLVKQKEKEIAELKTKLDVLCVQMDDSQKQLRKYDSKIRSDKTKMKTFSSEMKKLEAELKEKEAQILQQAHYLLEASEKIQGLEAAKSEHQPVDFLKEQLSKKDLKITKLDEEVAKVNKDLNNFEKNMKTQRDDHEKNVSDMKATFTKQKCETEKVLEQVKSELEQLRKKKEISDSLNCNMTDILKEKDETISHLEERLIEKDRKIEELSEEISIEVDDNQALKQSLDDFKEENNKLKIKSDLVTEDVKKLELTLKSLNEEHKQYKLNISGKNDDIKRYQIDVATWKSKAEQLEKENSELKSLGSNLQNRCDEMVQKLQSVEHQVDTLKKGHDASDLEYKKLKERYEMDAKEIVELQKTITKYEEQIQSQKEKFEQELDTKTKQASQSMERAAFLSVELSEARKTIKTDADKIQSLLKSGPESVIVMEKQKSNKASNDNLAKKDMKEMKKSYTDVQTEAETLRKELEVTQGNCEQLNFSCKKLKEQIEKIEGEHETQIDMMEEKVAHLNQKLTEALVENAKLQKEINDKDTLSDTDSEGGLDTIKEDVEEQHLAKITELEDELREYTDKWEEDQITINELRDKLVNISKNTSKTDSLPMGDQKVQSLQKQLDERNGALSNCQNQIREVLGELEHSDSNMDKQTAILEKMCRKLKDIISDNSVCYSSQNRSVDRYLPIAVDPSLRHFAEKLALEAVLLGRIAYCVQTSHDCTNKNKHLIDLQLANDRITDLELLLEVMETENCAKNDEFQLKQKGSMKVFAELVAEKLIAEGEIAALLEEYKELSDNSIDDTSVSQLNCSWINEIILRAENTVRLDSNFDCVTNGAISQISLTHLVNKMQNNLLDTVNKTDTGSENVETAHHKLIDRASDVSRKVDIIVEDRIQSIAKYIAIEAVNNGTNESEELSKLKHVERTIVSFVEKQIEEQKKILNNGLSKELDQCCNNLIDNSADREMNHALNSIKEETYLQLDKQSEKPGGEVESIPNATKDEDLRFFANILAQRALVSGMVGFIVKYGEDTGQKSYLQRHDSGVHTSFSPPPMGSTSKEPVSSMLDVSKNLTAESEARHHLSKDILEGKLDLSDHVTRLAEILLQVDSKISEHTKSHSFYVDNVVNSALTQAQIIYTMHRIDKKYLNKMSDVETGYRSHVSKLTAQIDDLNASIDEKRSNHERSDLVSKHRQELENLSDEHKKELEFIIQKYEKEKKALHDAMDKLEEDLDELQTEKNTSYEKQIHDLEKEIDDIQEKHNKEIEALQGEIFNMSMDTESNNIDVEEMNSEIDRLKQQLEIEKRKHTVRLCLFHCI